MEISKARPNQVSTQPNEPSKQSRIVLLLAQLGIRRQAKLDPEDYQVFAADLSNYALGDIRTGFKNLASRPRREGETAFPDLGTMLHEIDNAARARRIFEYKNRIPPPMNAEEMVDIRQEIAQLVKAKKLA